jgi:DNA-binding XRE family transcriptional regulator
LESLPRIRDYSPIPVNYFLSYKINVARVTFREKLCLEVARLLREEREKRHMSKSTLAQTSGLSRRMIGFVENGERNPTLDTLLRLTESLEIDLEKLIADARKAAALISSAK